MLSGVGVPRPLPGDGALREDGGTAAAGDRGGEEEEEEDLCIPMLGCDLTVEQEIKDVTLKEANLDE